VPFFRVSGNGSVVLGSSGEHGAYRCERVSGERYRCRSEVRQSAGCRGGGCGERGASLVRRSESISSCLAFRIHVPHYVLLPRMRAYHVRIVVHHISSSKSEQIDSFTPLSLWQPLPTHLHKSTARRNATFNPRGKDYRFGPIALDWVDLDNMSSSLFASKGRADTKGAFTARVKSIFKDRN
jgi:hypothetical protein